MNMPPQPQPAPPNGYTAGQIALALGVTKPTVLKLLRDIPAQGVCHQHGNEARTWSPDSFPPALTEKFTTAAIQAGESSVDYMTGKLRLAALGIKAWVPPVPISQVTPAAKERAEQLRRALAPALERQSDPKLLPGELVEIGLKSYQAVFGFEISGSYWLRLFKRTLKRSRHDGDLSRLEIYLDDAAAPQPGNLHSPANIPDELRPLRSLIEGFLKRGEPDATQKRQVLDDSFQVLETWGERIGVKAAKRQVIGFLAQEARFLAKNPAALRRNFERLYSRWQSGGKRLAILDDLRQGRTRGPELTSEELIQLIAYGAKYGGGMDQGWREAIRDGKLRAEVVEYYRQSLRRIPRKIASQISAYTDDVKMRMHGPRHAVLKGAYINRNPDHPANPLASGDVDQCDDMTFVNLVWDELPDGSLYVGQPQLLVWVDERSWFAYNFALILEKGYSAFQIRNSWTNKCDTYGLPRKDLYLEGSFWQTARVWVGRKDEVSWSETEQGIRRLGVRIRHAFYPRGKIIERIYGKLQNYLQREPGYVGRNAFTDRYEEVQKQLRLVKSGSAHPGDFGWYSKAEWVQRLGELLVKYNDEPGEGKYLQGTTPKQTYERCFTTPLLKVPENCRYLLACNKIRAAITPNGLTFTYGKKQFNYKDERLGIMRMKQPHAIAWFNPENPQLCGVTDLDGENPIVVKLETDLPNHDAAELAPEAWRQANAENAAMARHSKEVYRAVKAVFTKEFAARQFLPVASDGFAAERQSEFHRQSEKITAEDRAKTETVRRGSRAAKRFDIQLSPSDPKLDRRALGLSLMDDAFAESKPTDP